MKKIVPEHAVLIPDNATRVFQGDLFDVYQWPQAMFDGSSKTFEMLKRTDTVQVVAIRDEKIVLVSDEQPGRRGPRIHFPGGRVDEDDESWLAAAQREMQEETGLTFKNWRLVYVEQPQQKIEWFVPFFLATEFDQEVTQTLDSDGEKIEVVSWDFERLSHAILGGGEPTLNYAVPLFRGLNSLADLLALPEFKGQEIDR